MRARSDSRRSSRRTSRVPAPAGGSDAATRGRGFRRRSPARARAPPSGEGRSRRGPARRSTSAHLRAVPEPDLVTVCYSAGSDPRTRPRRLARAAGSQARRRRRSRGTGSRAPPSGRTRAAPPPRPSAGLRRGRPGRARASLREPAGCSRGCLAVRSRTTRARCCDGLRPARPEVPSGAASVHGRCR